jgi:hypothetical protein
MKGLFGRMAIMAVVAGMAVAAHAADISGTWKGSFDLEGISVPVTMNLKASGAALTGTLEGLPQGPVEIHDGKITGEALSFWLNAEYQGATYKVVYEGKVTADAINFSFGTDDGSWGTEMQVKRAGAGAGSAAAVDLTGQWKGEWDFNGNQMQAVFDLKTSGSTVSGTVNMGLGPTEIHDGKVEGDSVSFWINSEYQGQTYTLQYKGKVAGGQISFDFGIADGSWGSGVTVKKA